MTRPDILIVAAEPSGDQLGAKLCQSLQRLSPDTRVEGIGGAAMERAGLPSAVSLEGLAVLGFVEALSAYPLVLRKVKEVAAHIMSRQPRVVVLIDSWGFMVRLAKRLKATGYSGQVVKYVAPQVWAMRSGRARILARHVDHLLSTQPMDAPYFEAVGLPQTYVGNPVLDTDWRAGDGAGFRQRHHADGPLIGVFFGSRAGEIDRIGPAMLAQARRVRDGIPGSRLVFAVAAPVRDQVSRLIADEVGLRTDQDDLLDVLSAIDGALACSGTITTQLAAAGVPTVVLYRLQKLTYAVASRLFKPSHISLVNIAAGRALMPEFMQDEIDTPAPADALLALMRDEGTRKAASEALLAQTRRMKPSGSASDAAAAALLRLLG